MSASTFMIRFRGSVACEPGPGPGGVTLIGTIIETHGGITPAQLSLTGLGPPPLPPTLADPSLVVRSPHEMAVISGGREWTVRGTWQLHRDVGSAFFAAVPPRPTPWVRRFGWRLLLGIAAVRPGRWLLARLSGAD